MTYDSKRIEYAGEHIFIYELDLDYCTLTSGVGPCTATETGDAKCFNTLESTNDAANYTAGTKTYRFIEPRAPLPTGLGALLTGDDPQVIPCVAGPPTISPSRIDVKGGLGIRASVSVSFRDFPHSDDNIDKYVNDRTYIASDRGTFWTKLRSRNPNYQYKEFRVLSGYLEDDGSFDATNFTTRYYVIDKIEVTQGRATITAIDPLRLASNKKAQAPAPSTGQLQSAITAGAGAATLIPSGVGNAEYPASGKCLIGSEVISFTRSGDSLTLTTRGQNNTTATAHNANDTVQLCLEYTSQQVHDIVEDLLTNYANISSSFIPSSAWQSEVDTYLSGLISGIIVKPYDVNKLLIELAEQMPHYLWWDERSQEIQFTALKAPPVSANALDMDENIIEFSTTDRPEMRVSTVFVNFGQIDPTKRLDEPGNYLQSYARIDTDSISKYGSSEVKTINSRWITNTNKAAALQLAALIGRRFSDPPRECTFTLDPKDGDVWAGENIAINHRDIVDFTGLPTDTIFQIISAQETKHLFKYTGLEFKYGNALDEDEGGGDPDVDLVLISTDDQNINLRTIYNGLFPSPSASTQAKFIIEAGVIIGSTSTSTEALNTGSWPAGATITLQLNSGAFVVGKGGDGDTIGGGGGEAGGDAIHLAYDLTLVNNGVIGGGGGGGGYGQSFASFAPTGDVDATGAGGAGNDVGEYAFGTNYGGSGTVLLERYPVDGTLENGGLGSLLRVNDGGLVTAQGGNGGNLGASGTSGNGIDNQSTGGAAGAAIDKNGYTLTKTVAGDIRGSEIA